jgi:membrane protein
MKERLNNFRFYIKRLYQKYDTDQIWFMSSGVSYSLLWVLIPTLLIFLGILGFYFGKADSVRLLNEYINNALPINFEAKDKLLETISEKAIELSRNAWITVAIGLIGVFWAMSSAFSYMRDALNRIFEVKESLNFFRGKLRDFVLLLVIIFLFSFTTLLSSLRYIDNEAVKFLYIFVSDTLSSSLLFVFFLPFLISYIMFFFLYKYVPHYSIPTRSILFGAFIAALLYESMKYLFSYYVLNVSNYKEVYGAYAALVIFMLWVYVISLLFCTGAAISKIYMELHNLELKFYKKEKYGTEKVITHD